MNGEPEGKIAASLLLGLLALLPLVFLPVTIEVFIVPKAVLLWVLTALAAGFVAAGDIRRGRLLVPDSLAVRALAGFCLAAVGATITSELPYVSLLGAFMRREGLLTLLAYALVFILVIRLIETPDHVRRSLWAFILPIIPTSAYALAQAFGFEFVPDLNPAKVAVRAYGGLGNPDFLGIYAALMLPILTVVLLKEDGKLRLVAALSIPPLVLALLFSYSRSGWIGALIGVALVVATATWRSRRLLPAAMVLLLIAAGLAAALGLRALQSKPAETAFVERAASIARTGEGSAATRLEIWPRTIGLVLRRPLLGFGPESFRGQFMPVRGMRLVQLEGTARWDRPHNSLLYLAASTGLVGLACFLVFILSVIGGALRAACAQREGEALLALAFAAGALGASIAEFFVLWSPATTPLVFASLGLSVACLQRKELPRGEMLRLRLPVPVAVAANLLIVVVLAFVGWAAHASLSGERYADLGRAALERGDRPEASQYYTKATTAAFWINDYRWRAARVWERAALGSRDLMGLENAERILRLGLAIDPYDEQAYVELGQVYRHRATMLGTSEALPQAEASYHTALRLDPYSPEARKGLARLLFAKGDYRRALVEARRALQVEPNDERLLYLAGAAGEKAGDERLARRYFRRALQLDPGFQPAREALNAMVSGGSK